jgi:hypothetical protein
MRARGELGKPFRAFFMAGKSPILMWGQAVEKMREKSRYYCLGGPPRKQFYSGPGKVWA